MIDNLEKILEIIIVFVYQNVQMIICGIFIIQKIIVGIILIVEIYLILIILVIENIKKQELKDV